MQDLGAGDKRSILLEVVGTGEFTIGVSSTVGFVQFTKDGKPHLAAVPLKNISADQEMDIEFDAGGTPSPVPYHLCLPYDDAVEVVVQFIANEKLPPDFQWTKI